MVKLIFNFEPEIIDSDLSETYFNKDERRSGKERRSS